MKDIPSAKTVVKAAAFSFQIGIIIKFSTTLTMALTTVALKTTFSFCIGTRMHCPQNHAPRQNSNAMLNNINEDSARIYVLSDNIKTICFLKTIRPVIDGRTNVSNVLYMSDETSLNSLFLLSPIKADNLGIDTTKTDDKIVFTIE